MIKYLVYGLFDPITGELRYVGQTRVSLAERLKQHIKHARLSKNPYHTQYWILSLLKENLRPEIDVLQECSDPDDLNWWERNQIAYWRGIGARLTNTLEGGTGPGLFTQATKDKISASLKGKKPTPETLAKLRGRKLSAEHIAKRSASQRGRKLSAEGLAKISRLGKKWSDESRARHSKALKGLKRNPETVAKIANARRGSKHSAETIAKLSEARRLWWAKRKVAQAA